MAEGCVGGAGDGDVGVQQRLAGIEVWSVVGVDVGEVLVATLGDEVRLGDDRESVLAYAVV